MSLTDDWKAEKLKDGWYYTLITNDEITPNLWFDDEWDDFRGNVVEVLAPCDYEELLRLKKENEELKKENIKNLRYIGGLLVEGSNLMDLLKDFQKYLNPNIESDRVMDCEGINLLTRINEVLK